MCINVNTYLIEKNVVSTSRVVLNYDFSEQIGNDKNGSLNLYLPECF